MNQNALCSNPKIVSIESFLMPSEIETLMESAARAEKDSAVIDAQDGKITSSTYRVCKVSYMEQPRELIEAIRQRIAAAAGVRTCQLEGIQILKYGLGGHYFPHVDPVDSRNPGYERFVRMGGQRIISFLIGLKEAEEGGETDFSRVRVSRKLKPGELLLFWSLNPDGTVNHLSEHSAMPIMKGEKVVVVGWIRERSFDGSEEVRDRSEEQILEELERTTKKRERECYTKVESVLREFNCTLVNCSYPVVDPATGVIHVHREVRVQSK